VEPLGIKVIIVEPSGFRTDWAGRSANESKRQIDDYCEMAGAWRGQVAPPLASNRVTRFAPHTRSKSD
jgi:hypothetical protein